MKAALVCTMALLGAIPARAEWIVDSEAAIVYDNNVSRAQRASDIRSDTAVFLRISGGHFFQLDDRTSLTVTGSAEREEHNRYDGLSYLGLGPSIALRTKLGLGALAPWIRLGGSALRLEYDDDTRSGWLLALSAGAGKRVNERVDLRAELRLERRTADRDQALVPRISGAAFDLDSVSVSFNGDYSLSARTLLSFGYGYRVGDVVSSTRRNAAIFAASIAITPDRVFSDDTIAYKLGARSHSFAVGVSHALGNHLSLNLGVGRSLTYGDGANNYYSSNATASLLYNY